MSTPHPALSTRTQLAAIAELRWRLFVNALRTTRGKLELVSRIVITLAFAIGGLGGAFGMAVFEVEDISEVRQFLENDPSVHGGLNTFEIQPMRLGAAQAPK